MNSFTVALMAPPVVAAPAADVAVGAVSVAQKARVALLAEGEKGARALAALEALNRWRILLFGVKEARSVLDQLDSLRTVVLAGNFCARLTQDLVQASEEWGIPVITYEGDLKDTIAHVSRYTSA